jgi:hypothetical protein
MEWRPLSPFRRRSKPPHRPNGNPWVFVGLDHMVSQGLCGPTSNHP